MENYENAVKIGWFNWGTRFFYPEYDLSVMEFLSS